MLGRLARYLRFVGHDTLYLRGLDDRAVAERTIREHRVLLTRDRALAARVPGALLLRTVDVAGQLREIRQTHPEARFEVRFDRCSLCNGTLAQGSASEALPTAGSANRPPAGVVGTFYRCTGCDHLFWEGSHTAAIRASLARWLTP
jgi:uncharacterized protein with PIN domain